MAAAVISSVCFLAVLLRGTICAGPNRTERVRMPEPTPSPTSCRLLPFSGHRSPDGSLYALSATKIWTLSPSPPVSSRGGGGGGTGGGAVWRDSPLPQKLSGDAWRVVCASDRHVLLYDGVHAFLHTHRVSAWRNVTLGQARGGTPATAAIWCTPDEIQMLNLKTGSLTRFLGDGHINVTESTRLPVLPARKSHTHTWYHRDQVYVITDKYHNGTALLNSTTILWKASGLTVYKNWNVASQWSQGTPNYPDSLAKSYSWTGGEDLWLWRELGTDCELWRFNVTAQSWTTLRREHVSPAHGRPVLAWSRKSDDAPCLVFADSACDSMPYTYCLTSTELAGGQATTTSVASQANTTSAASQVDTATEISSVTPHYTTSGARTDAGTPPAVTTSPAATTRDVTTTTSVKPTGVTLTSDTTSPSTTTTTASSLTTKAIAGEDASYSVIDSDQSKWHQRNSGIFGSIIFFGTSITIFTIVGVVWCIRHCVHFPKEALLLRDPPSVRYTAIPDTIA
ncbi:uncharacterized protein LOC119464161 [Dermacentor silvarum]|uniref:uncharacterized protein LOC119464161 n=1 Tax=Dermacentor silvarum TaxID=543639 RepID=UPI0018980680|nr:uncharacterized protein LOC119464161 [Dermacentor silvarum]